MNQIVKGNGLDEAGREITDNREDKIGLRSFTDVLQFADRAAKTNMVPKQYQGKPDDIVISIMQGMEVGLNPLQALKSIAVINGVPTIYGDAPLALVFKSGKLEYIEETIEKDGDAPLTWRAVCRVKRKGQPEIVEVFSGEDAKQASLLGKAGPWTQYPARMLKFRARSFALRNQFPDVLHGIDIYEEVQDRPEMRDVTPEPEKGGTKVSKVADKVAQKRGRKGEPASDGPDIEKMVENMDAADTEAALSEAAKNADKLKGDDIERARKHYRARLDEIRHAAVKASQNAPDPEQFQALAGMIRKDLTDASDVDEVLDLYGPQIEQMQAVAPDLRAGLIALAEDRRKA